MAYVAACLPPLVSSETSSRLNSFWAIWLVESEERVYFEVAKLGLTVIVGRGKHWHEVARKELILPLTVRHGEAIKP